MGDKDIARGLMGVPCVRTEAGGKSPPFWSEIRREAGRICHLLRDKVRRRTAIAFVT
jgi:hypothetical protein